MQPALLTDCLCNLRRKQMPWLCGTCPCQQVLLVLAEYRYYKTLLENEVVNHTQQFALYIRTFLSSLLRSLHLSFLHQEAALKYFLYIHHKLFPLMNYYIMYKASSDCVLLLLLHRVDSLVVLSLGCKMKPQGREVWRNGVEKGSFNRLKIQLCRDRSVDLPFESVTALRATKITNKCW